MVTDRVLGHLDPDGLEPDDRYHEAHREERCWKSKDGSFHRRRRDHVIAWIDGGATSVANMTLLCTYHHHNFERLRWACRMINGIPWWIPPPYIDPEQKPLRNTRIDLHGPGTTSRGP